MSDSRSVLMTAEQAQEIDRYIELLMRAHKNERATLMMNLALAYKFSPKQPTTWPDNVVELHGFSRRAELIPTERSS